MHRTRKPRISVFFHGQNGYRCGSRSRAPNDDVDVAQQGCHNRANSSTEAHSLGLQRYWKFDIGHLRFSQLTAVKTRYSLTSPAWPYRELKFRAHRGLKLDHGLMSGQVVNQGLVILGGIKMFSLLLLCVFLVSILTLLKLKTEGREI